MKNFKVFHLHYSSIDARKEETEPEKAKIPKTIVAFPEPLPDLYYKQKNKNQKQKSNLFNKLKTTISKKFNL